MASSLITEHKSTHCFLLCEVSSVGRRDAPCLDKFAVRVQRVGVGSSFLFFFLRVNIIVCGSVWLRNAQPLALLNGAL